MFDLDEFIKNHKETYVNYFECLMDRDGVLIYARPSHQRALARVYCEQEGITIEQLWELMPVWESPNIWLVEKTGYIALYSVGYMKPTNCTLKQRITLKRLIKEGLVAENE